MTTPGEHFGRRSQECASPREENPGRRNVRSASVDALTDRARSGPPTLLYTLPLVVLQVKVLHVEVVPWVMCLLFPPLAAYRVLQTQTLTGSSTQSRVSLRNHLGLTTPH